MSTGNEQVILRRMTCPLKEHEKRYYAIIDGEGYDSVNLRQNLEAEHQDQWRVKLNLKRWRTAEELAIYLRTAANIILGANQLCRLKPESSPSKPF